MDDDRDVDDIEEVLREIAGDREEEGLGERFTADAPEEEPMAETGSDDDERPDAIAIVDDEPTAESIPTHIPLADESYGEAEDAENETEYSENETGCSEAELMAAVDPGERAIAIAEPMTTHDAQLVALGDNVRQVTQLIESVGRTLEAQNQRSLRLMERLEAVAKALEVMPEEADRNLEGLDAVGEAIHAQMAPLTRINDRLEALPEMVKAVRESNDSTRELWTVATRAMAGRLAFTAREEVERRRRDSSHRRWRVLAGAALAVAAFVCGGALSGTDLGDRARIAIGTALLGDKGVAQADEGERHWRVMRVVPAPPKGAKDAKAASPAETSADDGPLFEDEEATRR